MRTIGRVLLVLTILGIALPQVGVPVVSVAEAQAKKKRKNLLDLLFGGSIRKKRQQRALAKQRAAKRIKIKKVSRKKTKTRRKKVAAAPAAPVKNAIEKNEDAAKVLVVGDFMADGLYDGLNDIFAENPAIQFVNASKGLSGIVRHDVLDWPKVIKAKIEEVKPVLVVGLIGMNDRQEMRIESGRVKKLTEPWRTNYEARIETLLRNVRESRLPMVWVGLPPVSSNKMNADYLIFNEIYRNKVELFGGTFVDVWKGFVDIEGRFIRSGPNIDGQIVALRRSDGINMTRSGKRKLGFYTEKAVKRLTGLGKDALFSSLGSLADQGGFQPEYDPVSSGKTIVIALGAPSADGGSELEGLEGFITDSDAPKSTSFELLARGQTQTAVDGRIDSGWGKSSFALGRTEFPEPMLANMRGLNFKSLANQAIVAEQIEVKKDGEATKPKPVN